MGHRRTFHYSFLKNQIWGQIVGAESTGADYRAGIAEKGEETNDTSSDHHVTAGDRCLQTVHGAGNIPLFQQIQNDMDL